MASGSHRILEHPQALVNQIRRLVLEAGEATMPFYHQAETLKYDVKADGSLVSEADRVAEAIIERGLSEIAASVPMVGEEAVSCGRIPDISKEEYFWLVDPVDGTKGFGSGEYTVNVALIRNGQPYAGVVYAPVAGDLYTGWEGGPATRFRADTGTEKEIHVREIPRSGFTIITNRSRDDSGRVQEFVDRFKVEKTMQMGSSLKICLIAAGKADLYPRFGRIHEWDIAAAYAVLRSAGGSIVDMQGNQVTYGHPEKNFVSPEFIASSGQIETSDLLDLS